MRSNSAFIRGDGTWLAVSWETALLRASLSCTILFHHGRHDIQIEPIAHRDGLHRARHCSERWRPIGYGLRGGPNTLCFAAEFAGEEPEAAEQATTLF